MKKLLGAQKMCTHIHAFLTKIQVHFCLGSCEQNCILQDFLLLLPPYYARLLEPRGRGVWARGGGDHPRPDFGRSVKPISIRGTAYAQHITTRPLFPDFQTFLRPCYAVPRPTITMQRKTRPKTFWYRILIWIEPELYEISSYYLSIQQIIGDH